MYVMSEDLKFCLCVIFCRILNLDGRKDAAGQMYFKGLVVGSTRFSPILPNFFRGGAKVQIWLPFYTSFVFIAIM